LFLICSKPSDNPDHYRDQNTQQEHGGERKIKPEIFFFNSYIPRQAADPMQFIVKKINEDTDEHYARTNGNDIFSRFAVHLNEEESISKKIFTCTIQDCRFTNVL